MTKKITKILALLMVTLIFTSCATILNPRHQKITIHTSSSDSKVYVNDQMVGTGKDVTTKMKRNIEVKQVRIENDGFKPMYKVHFQDHKSALNILTWVPFGILFYPPFFDMGDKAYDYPKELAATDKMLAIKKREDNEKYVYLKNTAFDVKKEDIKYNLVKHKNIKKTQKKPKDNGKAKEDLKFDNTVFTDAVNEMLEKYNFVDTTNTIFKSKTNTLYISSKITKLQFNNVYASVGRFTQFYLITKMDVEWEIFDLYNQSKHKQLFKEVASGEFSYSFNGDQTSKNSLQDALTESFFKFLATKEVQQLIKKENEEDIKMEKLKIIRPAVVSNLEDAMEATVTIKTKDGHGSGCFISTDGYIITNFHVVAGTSDKITVINKEGKEFPAKLIRKNEFSDLALIKIEGTSAKAFTLPQTKNYKIGDDIFAIGTPKSIELGQSLSKGIISGFRTHEKNNWIQTDASVNGGNSGGALVSKSGEFIGVVNAKVFGLGVEGLGFSIPAETILTDLSLVY